MNCILSGSKIPPDSGLAWVLSGDVLLFLRAWGWRGVWLRWLMSPDSHICVRKGRKLQTYVGRAPFSPVFRYWTSWWHLTPAENLSCVVGSSVTSLDAIGAFGRKKKMGLRLSKSFYKIQTESDEFLPKESVFITHAVLVLLGFRGQLDCSHPSWCNSGSCCNVFILRMNLDWFSGLCYISVQNSCLIPQSCLFHLIL